MKLVNAIALLALVSLAQPAEATILESVQEGLVTVASRAQLVFEAIYSKAVGLWSLKEIKDDYENAAASFKRFAKNGEAMSQEEWDEWTNSLDVLQLPNDMTFKSVLGSGNDEIDCNTSSEAKFGGNMTKVEFVAAYFFAKYQENGCVPIDEGSKLHDANLKAVFAKVFPLRQDCVAWPEWRKGTIAAMAWYNYNLNAERDSVDEYDSEASKENIDADKMKSLKMNWALLVSDLHHAFRDLSDSALDFGLIEYLGRSLRFSEYLDLLAFVQNTDDQSGVFENGGDALARYLDARGVTLEGIDAYADQNSMSTYGILKRFMDKVPIQTEASEAPVTQDEDSADIADNEFETCVSESPRPKTVVHSSLKVTDKTETNAVAGDSGVRSSHVDSNA